MSNEKKYATLKDFFNQYPKVQYLDFLISDMNGLVRGKRIDKSQAEKCLSQGVYLPASVFALDISGTTVEETGLGLAQGDPDLLCLAELDSLATVPWQSQTAAQILMSMYELDRSPFYADPRLILKKLVGEFQKLNLKPCVAVEMEFYLLDQKRKQKDCPKAPRSPASGKRETHTQVYSINDLDDYSSLLTEIIHTAHLQNIPADTIIAEYAPAQFEVNLHHCDDPVKACDHAILLKRVIRAIASKHGFDVTFMAKPYAEQAGNGMHIHMSLNDEQGNNIYASEGCGINEPLGHSLAGVLKTLHESTALFCPNVNSYRRFSADFYVANSPNWGYDNRTTAIRIPSGNADAKRIEHRVAGADANPYLVMSALLSGVHHGLMEKLPLPKATEGDGYKALDRHLLPCNLRDALKHLADARVIRRYFGEQYLNTFYTCKEYEMLEFEKTISNLEYKWYLTTV